VLGARLSARVAGCSWPTGSRRWPWSTGERLCTAAVAVSRCAAWSSCRHPTAPPRRRRCCDPFALMSLSLQQQPAAPLLLPAETVAAPHCFVHAVWYVARASCLRSSPTPRHASHAACHPLDGLQRVHASRC
jgi:hypothetical protein